MKKRAAAIAIALTMVLAACGAENSEKKADLHENTEPALPNEKVSEKIFDDSLIEEEIYEGDFEDAEFPEGFHYSYRIPKIKDSTSSAKEFNESMDYLASFAKEENEEIPTYQAISWESHWNDGLLSLVTKTERAFVEMPEYSVINYDFKLGRSITNSELLKRKKISEKDAETALRHAAAMRFDKDAEGYPEIYEGAPSEVWDLRAQTISRSNLSIEDAELFLDDGGKLRCYSLIGVPAGGGTYEAKLCLERPAVKNEEMSAKCEFITAELKEGGAFLSFEDTPLARAFFYDAAPQFGNIYKIEGLYGNYTDMALSFAGNGGDAFLFLTDTEGRVSFCDIMSCIKCGPRFFLSGPLQRPKYAQSYRTKQSEDGYEIFAETENGSVDLYEAVLLAEESIPQIFGDLLWASEDQETVITVDTDTDTMTIECGNDFASGYAPRYIGMTEEGLCLFFSLANEEGEAFEGYLTFELFTSEKGPEGYGPLTLTQCVGRDLAGLSEGGKAVLAPLPIYN